MTFPLLNRPFWRRWLGSVRRRWPVVIPVSAALLAMLYVAADWWIAIPMDAPCHYTPRSECIRCHQKETDAWAGSDHDRAMDHATEETVLGDFNDREFTHFGTTSRLFRKDGRFMAHTDGPDGRMQDFEVDYVFGVRPLQQYLVSFPDGRVQCLPITWDTEEKRWFHLYPNEPIPHNDPLHWTRPLQNWNYMCAECHSTDLRKNYDLKSDTYHTTWTEIDTSCQACHGPGSRHVELSDAKSLFWDRRLGYGLTVKMKDAEDSRVEIETCGPCHSRRRIVYPGFQPGRKFLDHYMPELLDSDLYYADGQILDEDYVYGSFIQSLMYRKGVRCTDCHDPHTARVKYADPKGPWRQPIDNRLCTDCHMGTHPAGQYDTPAHHHHPDSSQPGTKCVDCHMPETTYMVVDPRRDHSMLIPRPDLTIDLGIPNACNGCHNDESKGETPEWAEKTLRQWYGERKGPKHFAHAIAAGRAGKPEGRGLLEDVLRRKDLSASVRASSMLLLSRYPDPAGHKAVLDGLRDPEGLVRAAAVRGLETLSEDVLCRWLPPLLEDPIRVVRTEAARLLSRVSRYRFSAAQRQAFDQALEEYMTGQQSLDDQPAAHLNMAVVYTNLGQMGKAEQSYLTALRLESAFVPARLNLAMFYNQQGRHAEAETQLREAIEYEPDLAEAHYSLGLLLAEQEGRLDEAAEQLAKAAELAPDNARIHYNLGLAQQRLERPEAAEKALATAYELASGNPDFLYALAVLYVQQERWARAVACGEELVRRWPSDPRYRALLEHAKHEAP